MRINKSILSLKTISLIFFGMFFTIFYGIGIFIIIYALLDRINNYIIIEKDRIIYRQGILNKKEIILSIGKSDINLRIDQNIYQAITGLCDFIISNRNEMIVVYAKDFPKKRVEEGLGLINERG